MFLSKARERIVKGSRSGRACHFVCPAAAPTSGEFAHAENGEDEDAVAEPQTALPDSGDDRFGGARRPARSQTLDGEDDVASVFVSGLVIDEARRSLPIRVVDSRVSRRRRGTRVPRLLPKFPRKARAAR